MTAATPLARYSAVEGALASGFATAQLHHAAGHDLQETEERLSACHGEAQGILRVTTTADLLPASSIAQLLKEFRECYPKVSVELDMTQRTVDLLQDGVHVAIRAGPLKDSLLISRKIGAASWRLAASPCYLQTAPELGRPKDLANHRILHFYTVGRDSWHLRRGRQTVTVSLPQHTAVNRIEVIKSLALIGEGIALMPAYYLRDAFADGTLIHVLPEWSGSTDPISVVYPAQKYLPANVRAFVDFVAERFRGYFDASLSK